MKTKIYNAAVYIRLSREDGDKDESDSVSNQKNLLLNYLKQKDDIILFDIYVDDGYTGTNFARPAFNRMIADIECKKVNCVLVKDLSRFGRDYIDTGKYLERIFPNLGVRFISLSDNIDSIKQAYDMMLPIRNIFNEQYARDISQKVHATIKSKQHSGDFIGAFASYGYKKSPTNKNKLIIDDYAADVVRRIFSMYIEGHGKIKIAKILNEEGVLCPSEYKKVIGENYKNHNRLESTSYWTYSTINNILNKEMYIGNMVQGTTYQTMRGKHKCVSKENWIIVENTHEPIIDQDTWDKVQLLLKIKTIKLDFQENVCIFAGFVKCADCGRAMVKKIRKCSDGRKSCTLYCGTYMRHGNSLCTSHSIKASILEDIVLDDLKTIIKNVEDINEVIMSQQAANSTSKNTSKIKINRIKSELERVKKLKKSVYEDFKDGLISKDEYLSYRDDYQKKEQLYSKQIIESEKENEEKEIDIFETPWLKKLLNLKDIDEINRDIIIEMISEIKIFENNKIKITYNFSNELEHLFLNVYNTHE